MEHINEKAPSNNTNKRVIVGLVLITLAGFLFADSFQVIDFNWHRYFWQLILIVIGLISLARSESRTTGLILIAIGLFFIVESAFIFDFPIRRLFWPIVIAAIGLLLIFRKKSQTSNIFSGRESINTDDAIDDVAIFGGSEQKVNSRNFRGGRITNIFGGSTFDMLDAQLAPGKNYIDVFCMFGGSKFLIPSDWKVRIEITAIFGGWADKRKSITTTETSHDRELVLKGLVLFGGGEVKNL